MIHCTNNLKWLLPSTEQTNKNVKQTSCCLICLRKASNSATIDTIGFARSRTPSNRTMGSLLYRQLVSFPLVFVTPGPSRNFSSPFPKKRKFFSGEQSMKINLQRNMMSHFIHRASCTTRTIKLLLNFKCVSPSLTRTSVNIHVLLVNLKLCCSPFKPSPVEQIISLFRHFPDMNYDYFERAGA